MLLSRIETVAVIRAHASTGSFRPSEASAGIHQPCGDAGERFRILRLRATQSMTLRKCFTSITQALHSPAALPLLCSRKPQRIFIECVDRRLGEPRIDRDLLNPDFLVRLARRQILNEPVADMWMPGALGDACMQFLAATGERRLHEAKRGEANQARGRNEKIAHVIFWICLAGFLG